MARTTATKVKQIISTDLSDAIVDAFIAGATELVTETIGSSTALTDTLKAEIERWLSAHLIASTRERQLVSGEAGPAKAVYQGKTGMHLEATMYGQQVMVLDTTGSFASLSGKAAKITAITSFE